MKAPAYTRGARPAIRKPTRQETKKIAPSRSLRGERARPQTAQAPPIAMVVTITGRRSTANSGERPSASAVR